MRKSDKDEQASEFLEDESLELDENEEYLHSKKQSPFIYRLHNPVNRLDPDELISARGQRLQEIRMQSVLREICTHLCFLTLLFVITYSSHNVHAFYQVKHLQKFFHINTKISTINDYWNWVETSFVSDLRAQQWYNHNPPRNLSGFINDKSNRLIGWAIMRQLRIKINTCHTHISSKCNNDYSLFKEEQSSYEPGWLNETKLVANSSIDRAFRYRTGDQLDTYVYTGYHASYGSGGYVYEFRGRLSDLRSNLSELHRLNWIDSQTRAVIIQFTLYNPNIQLFTSATILAEFLSSSGVFLHSRFEPISFQSLFYLSSLAYLFFVSL